MNIDFKSKQQFQLVRKSYQGSPLLDFNRHRENNNSELSFLSNKNEMKIRNEVKIRIIERSNRKLEKKENKNERTKRSMSLHQKKEEKQNNVTSTNDEFDDDDFQQLERIQENHDYEQKKLSVNVNKKFKKTKGGNSIQIKSIVQKKDKVKVDNRNHQNDMKSRKQNHSKKKKKKEVG